MTDSLPATRKSRDRLLEAAEALFAEHGYHGTPLRDITQRAGTRLADINELFGSKEALFQEVVRRKASVINADRLALLAQRPRTRSREAALRELVHAFAQPLLVRSAQGQDWRNYFRLLSQLTNTRLQVLALIADQFNPVAEVFVQEIARVLPHLGARQRLNAYQLMVAGVMAVFADNGRIDVMSAGALRSSDFAAHYEDMLDFVVGGMLGLRPG